MAIEISQEVREAIGVVQKRLADTGADVKWVDPRQHHVTVKFLGEIDEGLIGEIAARMSRAAAEVPAFELEVEGVDRLPEKGPVRVIMSRIISPDQRMTKLHRLIDSRMGGMGLAMETRVFVPHLTLGRVKSNRGLNRLLRMVEKHDLDFFGSFVVGEVVLYQSVMGAEGSVYTALHRAPLRVETNSPDSAIRKKGMQTDARDDVLR